jgi:DNA repair protein RecN (Recombination protein N)
VHARLRRSAARLAELDAREREREREKDLLAYQVGEIEGLGLEPGEVAELTAEESRLAHAERIQELLGQARASLDTGGADAMAEAAGSAEEVAALDPDAGPLAARLRSLAEEARDATAEVRARQERAELDPARLEAVRERLASVRALERKYGEGEEEILAFLARAREGLHTLDRAGEECAELSAGVDRLTAEAVESAGHLAAARRTAAPRLAEAVETELRELGMEGASVRLELRPAPELGPDGTETAELLLAGGTGQEPRPLAKVASGGELSRAMLACRTVLADLDRVATLVFDEVDAGIGGRAGVAVGRRLARLAATRQVLVVTHLPQIACFADRHFRVTKEEGVAAVAALEGPDRVEELSRMLSGMPTDEAAAHAGQLLEEAAREKAAR